MSCKGATTLSSCHIFYFLFPVSAIILLWTHMRLTGWLWYCFEGPCSTSCHQKQPFSHRGSIHALATASYFFILLSPVTQFQKSFDSQPGLSICFLNIFSLFLQFSSVQFSRSVVSHYLRPHELQHARPSCPSPIPEFTQTHVHRVSDAIQPSHPLSSPSSPAPNPSQHQSLFQWVNSSPEVAKVLELQL